MARAQFQKGQKVWVECVGAWAVIEQVQPIWAKGFDEPVRVTYDVGLGRDFLASELMLAADDPSAAASSEWRLMRARNKWQLLEDCLHHTHPGTYPVVVTNDADWGGWRVPGAEYNRDPALIEYQARLIAATPQLVKLAEEVMALTADSPEDAPPAVLELAGRARTILRNVSKVLAKAPESLASPVVAA